MLTGVWHIVLALLTKHPYPAGWIVAGLVAIVAIYVFIKIEHFLFRLVVLALIAGAAGWFFMRH